jgi:hypothetical protein
MKHLIIEDGEPFLIKRRPEEEMADDHKGFEAGANHQEYDDTKKEAWQRGWAEAQD